MNDLIGNLKTYYLKRQQDEGRSEQKKDKNLALKFANEESSEDDEDIGYMLKNFSRL